MDQPGLYRFAAEHKLAVLGTIAGTDTPQSALVGIAVTPELEIVFDTVRSSRKYANLLANPRCSMVIGWTGEKTVQYEGEAEELHDAKLAHYQAAYFRTWPDGVARQNLPGIVYFLVRPKWIRYCDFESNPPVVQEFGFPD